MLGRRQPTKRTPAEKRELAQEADRTYREKQRALGVPSTAEFADQLAYEVLRSNKSDTAEAIVTRCCNRMIAYIDPKSGKEKWTREGIRVRYQYCYQQMSLAVAAEEAEKTAKAAKRKTAA